jgi:3-oxoacid CoA-transferase B subunit
VRPRRLPGPQNGDLANWHTGEPDAIPAVGGAMDLATGAKQVFVMMTLFAKDGTPKLVPACSYRLTGLGCVSRVYKEWGVFHLSTDGVALAESFGIGLTNWQAGSTCRCAPRGNRDLLGNIRGGRRARRVVAK